MEAHPDPAVDDVSSPAWNLLPTPDVVPLSGVDAYRPPATPSPDPYAMRLVPYPVLAWGVVSTLVMGVLLVGALVAEQVMVVGCLPFLAISAWAGYHLVFAPRLTLDVERVKVTTYGLWHNEVSIAWADIASLRLRQEHGRFGPNVSLALTLRGTADRGPRHLDLNLGKASFERVDRALLRYCPATYEATYRRD